MNDLGKKAGYLKGLMEGMDFSENASEGKLLTAIADLLGDLCDRVEAQDELLDDLNDYVESIDDDLSLLEGKEGDDNFHYEDDEMEEELEEAYLNGMEDIEDHLHLLNGKKARSDDDEDLPEEQPLAGGVCPECRHMFFVNMNDPEDALYICPHCGKKIAPEPLTPENAPIAHPVAE